jgi:GrpB-like predicted nucleotidyltransferase (UPF0157 family)
MSEAPLSNAVEGDSALGLEKGRVFLREHEELWAKIFEVESERVAAVFAEAGLTVEIRHIGSTALPDIPAKPILDMAVVLKKRRNLQQVRAIAANLGWVFLAGLDQGADLLYGDGNPRRFHYHVTFANSGFARQSQGLMRALRRSAPLRAEYAEVKRELAALYPDSRAEYTRGKQGFLDRVLIRERLRGEALRLAQASRRFSRS